MTQINPLTEFLQNFMFLRKTEYVKAVSRQLPPRKIAPRLGLGLGLGLGGSFPQGPAKTRRFQNCTPIDINTDNSILTQV